MGIKQFTTYIKEHFSLLYTDEFHLPGSKLVFDGGALYYSLFRSADKRFGGDYYTLSRDVFKPYFYKLFAIGVTPYIVLDGGSNIPMKNDTICERIDRDVKGLRNVTNLTMSQCNLPKPALLKMVFIEVLIELGIHFVLANGEADMLVASLANRLGCPLVSGDSDFFIVDVSHGVIPMDTMLRSNMTKVARYRSYNLAKHLNIVQCLLPMIAVLLGNDYSEEDKLNTLQMHCGVRNDNGVLFNITDRVKAAAVYLRQFKNINNVIQNLSSSMGEELVTHVKSVLIEFDLASVKNESDELYPILTNICTLLQKKHNIVVNQNKSREMFLKHLIYNGLANPCLLDIYLHRTHFIRPQCENTAQKSCAESAEKLRTYLYCILLYKSNTPDQQLEVSEFHRKGIGYGQTSIQISIPQWLQAYPLDIMDGQYNKADKIGIMCKLTGGFPPDTLKTICEEDQVFVISLRYWVVESSASGAKLNVEHVQALIITFIHMKSSNRELSQCTMLDVVTAHHYCRWQSILFYLLLLNVVFCCPFSEPYLNRIYQGTHVHHLYHLLHADTNAYSMLTSELEQDTYNVLMHAVTEGVTSSLVYKQQNNQGKRMRNNNHNHHNHQQQQQQQQHASRNNPRHSHGNHANRFAMLPHHDDAR